MNTASRKRTLSEVVPESSTATGAKRQRFSDRDRLSTLSDELLIRVLSNLPVHQLVICQRVSQRFYRLAGDSQLWKAAYYARWVRPRALRLPGPRPASMLDGKSKRAAWLGESHLVAAGSRTDWQRQYKLRHNWSRGDCRIQEVRIAEHQPTPRTLIQACDPVVLTAEREQGLRLWRIDGRVPTLQSSYRWKDGFGPDEVPSAMTVAHFDSNDNNLFAVVASSLGSIQCFRIGHKHTTIEHVLTHQLSEGAGITALAVDFAFMAVLTSANLLYVYRFAQDVFGISGSIQVPALLTTLSSGSIWPPASLALRVDTMVNLSIAYALPQYLSGWSVGMQELQLAKNGELIRTRSATAADQAFVPLTARHSSTAGDTNGVRAISRPTALSLKHPYVLTAHSDNTLTLYMVRTTEAGLEIGKARKLWGHTSSVSAVHVGSRGKAVSVGIPGDEIRVWDLEAYTKQPKTMIDRPDQASVRVRSASISMRARVRTMDFADKGPDAAASDAVNDALSNDAWVGFDEERLLVLREATGGCEALVVYDFS